jgi:purine nucleosidase
MQREKVILDVDTANGMPIRDIDDGLAIALALSSPEIDLLGLTTCGGNCRTEESTYNSLIWLEQAGRGDIPVAEGRLEPFLEEVGPNFEFWDKRSDQMAYLWKDVPPIPPPTIEKSPLPAHEFIIEMVKKYPGEVNIVKEGALTNLALALLVEPEIAPLVKSVIHMGGTFHSGSGLTMREPIWSYPNGTFWRHFLRMNTEFDPLATEIVVRSGIPFYFVTGAVTSRVFLRKEHIEQIAAVGTPYHDFVADTSRPWVDLDVDLRGKPGSFMHDPLALAILIDPTFCTFVQMHCDLERFHKMDYPYLYVGPDSPQAYVSVDVDVDRFETFLAERLAAPVIKPAA